jgi:hypothetical protein
LNPTEGPTPGEPDGRSRCHHWHTARCTVTPSTHRSPPHGSSEWAGRPRAAPTRSLRAALLVAPLSEVPSRGHCPAGRRRTLADRSRSRYSAATTGTNSELATSGPPPARARPARVTVHKGPARPQPAGPRPAGRGPAGPPPGPGSEFDTETLRLPVALPELPAGAPGVPGPVIATESECHMEMHASTRLLVVAAVLYGYSGSEPAPEPASGLGRQGSSECH